MLRKITRIFFKSLGVITLFLIVLGIGLYFGVQSYTFQTWLGKKASSYLSRELKSIVYVNTVNLEFFSKANLKGIIILDKHKDTILHGDILIDIKTFDYKQQKIEFGKISLNAATSKLIKYKNDSSFNYQYLIDYFATGKKDTVTKQNWNVKLGDIILNDVHFVYRNENNNTAVTRNINFDNISLKHTYGLVSKFRLDGDTILATVTNFKTTEQSGFDLLNLSTRAKISSTKLLCENLYLKTPRTLVKGKIDFSYSSWDDYGDFLNKIKINSVLEDSTHVSFTDIASFSSELNGLDETVSLSGIVKGYVNDINLKQFKLAFGKYTRFNGNLSMTGLPDIKTSYLHFDAKEISTNYLDLVKIPMYPFAENKKLELPISLKSLETVSYKGKFDGFVTDFTTYGKFKTGLGNIETQLSIKLGEKTDDIAYHGKIKTENFSLGTLLGQKDFNALSLDCEIKGKGVDIKTLDASIEGKVNSITFNGYNYKNISLNGSIIDKLFNGLLISKDPNADFDFNGTINFSNSVPEMDFISTINNLRLNELKLLSNSDSGNVSSQIFINIKGNNLDNLSGQINFDNTIYKTTAKTFKLSTFNIQLDQANAAKKIKLNSAYLNALVQGNFNLSNLKLAFESFLFTYYPTFFKKPVVIKKHTDQFTFNVKVKKFNAINELFLPDIMLSPNSTVEGDFNASENKLNIQFSSSKTNYKSFSAKDILFILNENKQTVVAELSGKALNLTDSLALENFNVVLNSTDNSSTYSIDWDNLKQPLNKGELKGQFAFNPGNFYMNFDKIALTLRDSTWNLVNPNSLTIEKTGSIFINPLLIQNNLQTLNIAGTLSEKTGDSLVISTHNVILEQFNPLLKIIKLKLEGVLNGNVTLSNANKNFAFSGDLNLSKLKINDNLVGELSIKTNYYTKEKYISLAGYTSLGLQDETGNQLKNISFKGNYYLNKKEESIDIDFAAKPANLKLLNPLLEGILTIKNGYVNGAGKIHGTPDNLKIDGKLKLFNSEIKVDYTNVTYNFTGDIEIMPDQIRFSDILMREKGTKTAPQGTVNGNIFHTNFSRIQLDYDISYKNMLILNTTEKENTTFYGKVYGTGNAGVYGYLNNLYMTVTNVTNKNSKFYLPLDGPAEIGESDFIHFVKRDTIKVKKDKSLTGFNLEMNLTMNPDFGAQIILDKKNGDALNVQGQGDLKVRINTLGKFEMFGDYIITDGSYLFTLENVINKKFDIDAGSSISWSGNPLNAEIDVVTSYKQRASIAPLLNDTSFRGRFPVDCKLIITGKLFSPNIKFAIDFPNIDATAKARIDNVLSDEAELNRQVFSFLLFRTFVTPQIFNSNGGGVTAGNAAASTGSEMLSNRVSEFLNTYFGNLTGISNLQLGLNYRPSSQNSNEAVDLALSKQFLNNRVSVDGNFGVNSNARYSNGLIGDVNIDYKLSDDGRYRLKGFNRSNDNMQATTAGGPYTQGIGVFYRKEFETLRLFNLFSSKYKKEEKPKK